MHTPKKGTPPRWRRGRAPPDRCRASARAQAPNAPTPGQHDGVGRLHLAGRPPGAPPRRRAGAPSRPSGGCRCRSRGRRSRPSRHRLPLVEGIPPPSTRTASRRHRATPLKLASNMWCVFFPSRRRMCSVRFAAVAKARQNSSASWGSKGGVPSPGVSGANSRCRPGRADRRGRAPPRSAPRRAATASTQSAGRPACRPRPRPGSSRGRCPTSSTV